MNNAKTSNDKLLVILDTHIQFERIHPFSEGNGRMVLLYFLLQEEFPPLIIEKETKAQYVESLANQDVESLFQFAKERLDKEQNRMQAFPNTDAQLIEYD